MIINCVICQESKLLKSSIQCNICHCRICQCCLLKMKSLKKHYLRLCPLCRGNGTLLYNNGNKAFDVETFPNLDDQRRLQIIVTVPKVILSWILLFVWIYCLSSVLFDQGKVNVPLCSLCLLVLTNFYCCS